MSKQGLLSYQYDEFMKYKNVNNVLPQHLVPYCTQDSYKDIYPNIEIFEEQLKNIISSVTKGDDPNNVILRTYIKFYVNMIHQGNYDEYLKKLKDLNYSTRENMHFLLSELIICASRCAISVKGFSFQEDSKHKTIPEICADITKNFSEIVISNEEHKFSFHSELIKLCQQFFLDFVDLNKSLDENNDNTSDNYKGFMTFMGLLYGKGIIGTKIVLDCIEVIKKSIFCSTNLMMHNKRHNCDDNVVKMMGYKKNMESNLVKCMCFYDCELMKPSNENTMESHRKNIECTNLYKGYEHLLSHIINTLEKTNGIISNLEKYEKELSELEETDENYEETKSKIETTKTSIEKVGEFINILIKQHQEIIMLNRCYTSLNKNQLIHPFKTHVLLIHNSMGNNLNKVRETIVPHCETEIATYESVSIGKLKM